MSNEHAHEGNMVKTIWKTFWILLVVTVVEIAAAITITGHIPQGVLNTFYILMSLTKAFYIVSVFMHLKFELKYLVITILIPFTFLLFAVGVFLAEGASWLALRNF